MNQNQPSSPGSFEPTSTQLNATERAHAANAHSSETHDRARERARAATGRHLIHGMWPSGLVGGLAMSAGVALTAASAWLIVAASFQPPILWLLTLIVSVRAFGIARPVLRYVERLMSHNTVLGRLADTRTAVYRALIPLTPARLGRKGRGDVLAGVVDDLDDIAMAQIRVGVPFIALGVAGLMATLVNGFFLFPAAAVTACTVLATACVGALDYAIERRAQATVVAARGEVGQLAAIVTNQASELASIGAADAVLARLREAENRATRALTRQAWGRAVGAGLSPLVNVGGSIAMAYVVSPYIERGLSTPLAALLILTPIALGEVVGAIPDAVGSLARAKAAQDRLHGLLDQEPAVAAEDPAAHVDGHPADQPRTKPSKRSSEAAGRKPGASSEGAPALSPSADTATETAPRSERGIDTTRPVFSTGQDSPAARGSAVDAAPHAATPPLGESGAVAPETLALETRQVTAAWDSSRQALDPVSIEIPPGTMLAITGPNGSGKSTLLAVLARHLDPSGGVYLQNDSDALDLPLDVSRAGLAVVDDETHVLASNVRENLRFTRPGASDEQIVDALRASGLSDWLAELPKGLDTRVGAGAQGVSGGERTRLGIARALLSGRPVILLDEPTAHLDNPTALAVLGDLHGARADRTVVLVTHREEGLPNADQHLAMR